VSHILFLNGGKELGDTKDNVIIFTAHDIHEDNRLLLDYVIIPPPPPPEPSVGDQILQFITYAYSYPWDTSIWTTSGILNWDLGDASSSVFANKLAHTYASSGNKIITMYAGTATGATSITSFIMDFAYILGTTDQSLGTFNISNLTNLGGYFSIGGNDDITSVMLPTSSNVFTHFDFSMLDISTIDLTTLSNLGGQIWGYYNANLTEILNPDSSQVITQYYVSNCNLPSIDFTPLINLGGRIDVDANTNLETILLPTLTQPITYFNARNCAIDISTVDDIFAKLDTYYSSNTPISNITVYADQGTNSPPTDCSMNSNIVHLTSIFNGAGRTFTYYINCYLPTVTTSSITDIDEDNATGGGNVTHDGGILLTYRGVCISTNTNPTIADVSIQDAGTGEGSFISYLTNLTPDADYYVRAFAYNSYGLVYGANVYFSTPIVYTACATYDPHFDTIYEETGFLNTDVLSLTTGTLGNYVIDWKDGSTNGPTVFVSGSSFAADPSVQVEHPIENEIVFGGLLYPVLRTLYVNSIKYSAYNAIDASYSPDLKYCLDPINVEPFDCDTSINSNYVYPLNITYNNLTDYAVNKSRTIRYNLCTSSGENVKYAAWSFDAQLVPEQLKIYYCTSSNYTGTLLDNFIHGYSTYGVTTNLYPTNYPDGSARTYARSTASPTGYAPIRYITNFSDVSYNTGDYLRIEVIGGVYQPELESTNWEFGIKSFYENDIDCSFFDASIGQIDMSFDPSMVYNAAGCRYDVIYKTLKPSYYYYMQDPIYSSVLNIPWLMRYTMLTYTNIYNPAGGFNDTSVAIGLRTSTQVTSQTIWSSTYTICVSCADNGSVTYNIENIDDVSTYTIQYTSASDYESFKTDIGLIQAAPGYSATMNSPDSSIEYYAEYRFRIFDCSACGDDQTYKEFYIHLQNEPSWNDSTQTISIPCVVPAMSTYIFDLSTSSCNETYTNTNTRITYFRNTAAGYQYYGGSRLSYPLTYPVKPQRPLVATAMHQIILNESTKETFYTYYIDNALLNGVCDLSLNGFMYDVSTNYALFDYAWAIFNFYDYVTITNMNDKINNWKLERRRFLSTLNPTEGQWDRIWEVSLGQVIYP
jgi:hypothetical protein